MTTDPYLAAAQSNHGVHHQGRRIETSEEVLRREPERDPSRRTDVRAFWGTTHRL